MTDNILLVDDDPTLRRLLGDFLTAEAFAVGQGRPAEPMRSSWPIDGARPWS